MWCAAWFAGGYISGVIWTLIMCALMASSAGEKLAVLRRAAGKRPDVGTDWEG